MRVVPSHFCQTEFEYLFVERVEKFTQLPFKYRHMYPDYFPKDLILQAEITVRKDISETSNSAPFDGW